MGPKCPPDAVSNPKVSPKWSQSHLQMPKVATKSFQSCHHMRKVMPGNTKMLPKSPSIAQSEPKVSLKLPQNKPHAPEVLQSNSILLTFSKKRFSPHETFHRYPIASSHLCINEPGPAECAERLNTASPLRVQQCWSHGEDKG